MGDIVSGKREGKIELAVRCKAKNVKQELRIFPCCQFDVFVGRVSDYDTALGIDPQELRFRGPFFLTTWRRKPLPTVLTQLDPNDRCRMGGLRLALPAR